LFVSISFFDFVCDSCLPSRTCSHNEDAWASSPYFSPLGFLLFLRFKPARHLESRHPPSIRLLLRVQTTRANHLFAMYFANRSMSADYTSNDHQSLFLSSEGRKRLFLDVLCALHNTPSCDVLGWIGSGNKNSSQRVVYHTQETGFMLLTRRSCECSAS
jgi:hypothetical protein